MASWLDKIITKVKTTLETEPTEQELQQVKKESGTINLTGIKNTANEGILAKNYGNVPLVGNSYQNSLEDPIQGYSMEFTTSKQPAKKDVVQKKTTYKNTTNNFNIKSPNATSSTTEASNKKTFSMLDDIKMFSSNVETSSKTTHGRKRRGDYTRLYTSPEPDADVEFPEDYKARKNGVKNYVYQDGKAYFKTPKGDVFSRVAFKGEPGYVKDGESIEERLQRFYPTAYENAKTPEDKAKLLKKYFEGYYSGLDSSDRKKLEIQAEDFFKLLKNSDRNSEMGAILSKTVNSLYAENRISALVAALDTAKSEEEKKAIFDGTLDGLSENNDVPDIQKEMVQVINDEAKESNAIKEVSVKIAEKSVECGENATFMAEIAVKNEVAEATQIVINNFGNYKVEDEQHLAATVVEHMPDEKTAKIFGESLNKLDKSNQVAVVENSLTNIENEEFKNAMNIGIASNIALFDKKTVKEVSKSVIKHDNEEHVATIEMSNHVHETDVSVQKTLAQMLMDTKIEPVINNMARNSQKFDKTNIADIISMLEKSEYESTQKELVQAKEEVAKQLQTTQVNNQSSEKVAELKLNSSSQAVALQPAVATVQTEKQTLEEALDKIPKNAERPRINIEDSEKKLTKIVKNITEETEIISKQELSQKKTIEKIEYIKKLDNNKKKQVVAQLVESATFQQLKNMIFNGLKTDVIKYLISNRSAANTEKLNYLKEYLTSSDLKQIEDYQKRNNIE